MWVSALVGGVCAFLSCLPDAEGLVADRRRAVATPSCPASPAPTCSACPSRIGAFFSGGAGGRGDAVPQPAHQAAEDAIIGLIFSSFFGLGLFMVSLSPTAVNIQTIVLGNILAITPEDTLQLAIIGFVSLVVLLVKWKDLMVTFFDENHARSIGLNPTLLKIVFFTLLVGLDRRGAADGRRLPRHLHGGDAGRDRLPADRPLPAAARSSRWRSAPLTSFVGAYASYFLDGATGGIIVVLQTADLPRRLLLRAQARHARGAAPRPPGSGERRMSCSKTLLLPFQFEFMRQRADHLRAGRGADGAAVVLPGAQGLVADGRCHLPRGVSGRGHH